MTEPLVCISVLNWNKPKKTMECIESLRALKYTNYIIVVTDNASTDNSFELLQLSFPEIHVIRNQTNTGYAGGHYQALNYAETIGAELFWVLNNDLLVEQNTLFCLAKHYLRHSGHIYGSVPFFNGLPQSITLWSVNNGRVDFDSKLAVEDFFATNGQPLATSEYLELANVHGSSMLIPLNIVEQHGFLDKSFFMYAEEIEFCFRLLSKGITSHLVLSSRVVHESGGSTNDNAKTKQIMSYYQRRNFLVVLRRYRGWPFYLELQKTYFKEFIVRIVKGKRVDRYKMLGCLHALIGLMGKRLSNESLS